jgi:hypothetical protein
MPAGVGRDGTLGIESTAVRNARIRRPQAGRSADRDGRQALGFVPARLAGGCGAPAHRPPAGPVTAWAGSAHVRQAGSRPRTF